MIYICKTEKLNNFLEKYILDFIKFKGYKLIGIDFEFNRISNKRQIALCQINFEKNKKESDIFLFYPPNINTDIFEKLLISKNIIKIIHGGESLDIPYLFENIIKKNNRLAFCENLYDTRYMCEYYNSSNMIDGKCKIYDLLLQMNVITKSKYDHLMENDKLMGNIWDIIIDINNMSKELIQYSIYDVEFLPDLFRAFPNNSIYTKLIPNIACINFNLRYEDKLNKLFTDISSYNLVKLTNEYTYNDVYTAVFYWIMTEPIFYNLYSINYFKKFIELLIKNIVYNKLDSNIQYLSNRAYADINVKFIKQIKMKVNEMF